VPALECEGIIDISKKQVVYSHYEIDRTPTGRMVCQVPGRGFNPHGIGKSDNYKPRGEDEMFLHLDFRSMEVRILQWLSHDLVLGELLNGERDVYEAAWERITGQTTTPDQWKTTFLAVFFGMGAEAMSMRHGWSPEISKEIIVRMGKVFPLAMGYVRDAQEHAKTQIATDYFGRPRDVRDNPYLARNHVIQSPASVVCMEKLIKLYDELPPPARLGFSVHDGYALYCEPRALMDVTKRVISILESESNFCPGLRLPVSAKVGARLNKLVSIPTTWR
jgi:DNA polymerase I-like protein with 3'-5' exonuclease and polymerase domains